MNVKLMINLLLSKLILAILMIENHVIDFVSLKVGRKHLKFQSLRYIRIQYSVIRE